jgi:dihydrofolate reductase
LRDYWPTKNIFIIGGAELIEQTKDLCDFAYIAHRKGAYYTDVRVNIDKYLSGMRITSSCPSGDRTINFCIYKNIDIFRPIV